MNFLEAVKAINEGKKVRLPGSCFLIESNHELFLTDGLSDSNLSINNILDTTWEVVEETPVTLSDKIMCGRYREPKYIRLDDVEVAIKEVLEDIKERGRLGMEPSDAGFVRILRKRFGEELLR